MAAAASAEMRECPGTGAAHRAIQMRCLSGIRILNSRIAAHCRPAPGAVGRPAPGRFLAAAMAAQPPVERR